MSLVDIVLLIARNSTSVLSAYSMDVIEKYIITQNKKYLSTLLSLYLLRSKISDRIKTSSLSVIIIYVSTLGAFLWGLEYLRLLKL